jgi:hypothetical protein
MAGARIANMPHGGRYPPHFEGPAGPSKSCECVSIEAAAELVGASARSIKRARKVLRQGTAAGSVLRRKASRRFVVPRRHVERRSVGAPTDRENSGFEQKDHGYDKAPRAPGRRSTRRWGERPHAGTMSAPRRAAASSGPATTGSRRAPSAAFFACQDLRVASDQAPVPGPIFLASLSR